MSRHEESVAAASLGCGDHERTLGARDGVVVVRRALVDTAADPRLIGVAVLLLVCLSVLLSVISAVWVLVGGLLGPASPIAGLFLAMLAVVCIHVTFSCYVASRHGTGSGSLAGAARRVGANLGALAGYAAATTGVLVGSTLVFSATVQYASLPRVVAALGPVAAIYGWLVCTYYWTPLAVRMDSLSDLVKTNWILIRRSWRAVLACQTATILLVLAGSVLFATGVGSMLSAALAALRTEVVPLLSSLGLAAPLTALLGLALGAFAVPLLGVAYPLSRNAKYRLFERVR